MEYFGKKIVIDVKPCSSKVRTVELEWKQNLKQWEPHLRRDDRAHDNLHFEYFNSMASLRVSVQLQLRS
jgi:hypothetical protein